MNKKYRYQLLLLKNLLWD